MGLKLSDKARAVISAVAPTLGTALGGPFGGLAGTVLAKALGGEDVKTETAEAVLEAQSPETLLKLKESERAFLVEMERLEISKEQLVFDDRKNARERDARLGGDRTTKILAYTIVGAFVAMCFTVLFKVLAVDSIIAGTVIGYLSAKCEQVISYYFGSSHGSKEKTEALAMAIRK